MAVHVHVGALEFFNWLAYMIIAGFLWRSASARLAMAPEGSAAHTVGLAMAFIY